MAARVNLLPDRYAQRIVERRWTGAVAGGLLVLLLLLALLGMSQTRRLTHAEAERATEQARTQQLTARRSELAPFRQLGEEITGRERLLAAAMHSQISWAGVLARLSAAFPPDASLTSFTAESIVPAFSGAPPRPDDEGSLVGTVTFTGYSTRAFSPGVAELLQLLAAIPGVAEPQLVEGVEGEIGEVPVTTFDGAAFVDGTALTGRYAEGLPAGERVEVPRVTAAATGTAAPGGGNGAGR